jgi:hypothetical protein
MDYLEFTQSRIRFLRYLYTESAARFLEIRRKIEAHEEPYNWPIGYEDSEPPYLDEWVNAGNALDVLGQSVASLLSETLHLFIKYWVDELVKRAGAEQLNTAGVGLPTDQAYKAEFKKGWLNGYKAYCAKLEVDWTASAAHMESLEQLVLARNTVQHPTDITSVRARQPKADAEKLPRGVFADAIDIALNESMNPGSLFLRPPRLDISGEKLHQAFDEVKRFCSWLDLQHSMR